ncbi:HAMP domain-containing histidine kinase [Kocuria sp. cx-116]|uniref:histidine kinase dimerization/phospho-acceptor domain-containing protein n=1 Tax=Kocuria sp. cx-116 TaxID=2771378 RepID=UPI0016878F73|nr:HAMP domain-containing sensor histidine kinase [Kocuria sp. cx-116]MBD2761246.1 HAMP domain-containing histidine kinase [Kocuria sp. cx-116]
MGEDESTEGLMRAAIESAVPGEHESFLAFLDDRPQFKPQEQAFELDNPETVEQILGTHAPGSTIFTDLEINGEAVPAAVASVDLYSDDTPGIFVAANRIQSQRDQIWISAVTYTVVSLATLLVSALVGLVVTGKLMRPIGELRNATREITIDDLERRVPDPGTRDDVAALAQNFNRMLERIREGYAHQRQFMSDVSHELRTPLTIIRGTLETTDRSDPADVSESHEIALDELDRMNNLVTDLATLVKTGRPDFVTFAPVDMAEFARNAMSRIEHLGPRQWLLGCGTDVVARADEDRLIQAVVQLAANATHMPDPEEP